MSRTPRILLAFLIALFATYSTLAQQAPATGTPPFGSFGGPFGTLNVANLNDHLTAPVFSRAGRGIPFNYNLQYDTSVWYPVGSSGNQTWTPVQNWGLLAQTAVTTGKIISEYDPYDCYTYISLTNEWVLTGHRDTYQWDAYVDPWGVQHPFPNGTSSQSAWGSCNGVNYPQWDANATTMDGTGYTLVTANSVPKLTARNGSVINAPQDASTGSGTYTDRNGNQISVDSSGNFTDTLGTRALAIAGSGTSTSPMVFTYSAPGSSGSGTNASVTINYTNFTVATNFGISNIHEFGANAVSLPTSIVLPDGSQYSFGYEPTPSVPSTGACTPLSGTYQTNCVTARLASITFPTGGTITYTYTGGNNGIFADGSTAGLNITTPDTPSGTKWIYTRTPGSGAAYTTKVTDPLNNDTVIQFQGIYETQRQTYQGSSSSGTLLQTVNTCYNGVTSPCTTTAVSLPITRRAQLIASPDNTGSVCKRDEFFDSYGLQTEQDDYDCGPGAPATSPLRKVITVYNRSLTNGIASMPSSVTVCNGTGTSSSCTGPAGSSTGTVVGQTTFAYDETAVVAPTGTSPQHNSITGSRGNATTIKKLVQGTTFLTSTMSYYDTGNPKTVTDVNGAQTTFNYPDATSTCGNAFPTSISEPLSMSRSMTRNCTGGLLASVTDENSQQTTITYNDANFWRPAKENFPDGGQTIFTYNSPTSATTTAKMNSSQNIVSTVLLDSLGRTKETQLNSDPQGVDYTDTTYDVVGRVASVSNPYRSTSDPTYGLTSYQYDALGRFTKVIPPDGTSSINNVSASYSTNTTTITDQAGKKRQSTIDGLGRMTQVTEDPGGLGYVTTYSYDALSNLISVMQNGGRQRTYTYDALSRLVCESNPEIQIATCPNPDNGSYTAGTIRYGYDNGGNLATRQAPAPNQTGSATVTTTYSWDALHRLTYKSYSDGTTPPAGFFYDLSTYNGIPISNPVGRLVHTSNYINAASTYSYDAMGRIIKQTSCLPVNCTDSAFPVIATYDLAGNLLSETNGMGYMISYGYDTASRPISVTSNLVDSQHPATLATVDSTIGYWPTGALRKLFLANGLVQANAYNNRLQPCRMNVNSTGAYFAQCADAVPNGNVLDFTYGFNAGTFNDGSMASWSAVGQQAFSRTFGYDSLNRLTTLNQSSGSATGCSSTFNLSWTYDSWGNRTDQTVNSGTCNPFHATVNTKNQLVDAVNNKYQYDAAGNMIQDANHTYFYDAENRLVQVGGTFGTCSTATACYVYDAGGLRVESNHGSWQMDYVHDFSGKVVADWETSSGYTGWATGYVYLNGGLLAQYQNSTTHFAHTDHLGSTRLLTGLDQSVVQNVDYLPFGELNSSDSGINTHKFTGDERDSETDLDHTWFRQYSSSLGRWMHPDPAGRAAVDPTDPQTLNAYAYVRNTPLNFVDPLGLQIVCIGGQTYDYVVSQVDGIYAGSDLVFIGNPCGAPSDRTNPCFGTYLPSAGIINSMCAQPPPPPQSGGNSGVDKFGHHFYKGPGPCTLERRKAALNGLLNIGIGIAKVAGGVSLTAGSGGVGVAFGGYLVVSGLVANIGGGLAQIGGAITGNLSGAEQAANASAAAGSVFGLATLIGSGGNVQLAGNAGRVEALAVSPFSLHHGGFQDGVNSARELLGSGAEPPACGN